MNNDIAGVVLLTKWRPLFTGEKLLTLKQRLQLAMAQRRQEERVRKAELNRLDNEDCGEEEEEAEMTDEDDEVAVFVVTLATMCSSPPPPFCELTSLPVFCITGFGRIVGRR